MGRMERVEPVERLEVDIDVDDDGWREPRSAAGPVDFEPGPGWFGSSRALRCGLEVVECDASLHDRETEAVEVVEVVDDGDPGVLARLFGR